MSKLANLLCVIALLTGGRAVWAQTTLHEPEERVIRYEVSDDLQDPVSVLARKVRSGHGRFKFEPGRGYLDSLLKALSIPVSSQCLVFSKTSLQPDRVSPATPRAVYFNDDTYVSWVPGGDVIDISSVDPNKGPIFYTLAQRTGGAPRFTRDKQCMRCHMGAKTLDVPGHLLRSVVTSADGRPLSQIDGFVSGHESPYQFRWGGWYVTGLLAADVHRGAAGVPALVATRYLSPGSDVIALMVLSHQVKMHNLITRANYEARFAEDAKMSAENANWSARRISNAAEPLLEYLLFRDEPALHGPVKASSAFAEEFERQGPRDSKGRSLRDLDLTTRLMRYPCSYLIYSRAFDALRPVMKNYLWRRLFEILTGKDGSKTYAGMPAQDREAVFDILRETKPEFAAWLRSR